MKKRKIVVVFYGHPHVDASCLQFTNDKELVWMRSEDASEILAQKFLVIHCKRDQYTTEDMPFFCKSTADKALDVLTENDSVLVVLPWEIRKTFFKQLAIAKQESEGDVVIPPFDLIDEHYQHGMPFDSEYVFSVHERFVDTGTGKKGWLVFFEKLNQTDGTASSSHDQPPFDLETVYAALCDAIDPDFSKYTVAELQALLDKSLDVHNFDLTKRIFAAQEKKKAS